MIAQIDLCDDLFKPGFSHCWGCLFLPQAKHDVLADAEMWKQGVGLKAHRRVARFWRDPNNGLAADFDVPCTGLEKS